MTMKKFLKYMSAAVVAAGVMATPSCSDFLDVEDESSVSDANFPTNMEHVDLLLNSAYAGSHGLGLYAYYWFPEIMYLLDHTHDTYGNYDSRSQFETWDVQNSNSQLEKTYGDIMCWIQYANQANDACEAYRPKAAQNEIAELDYRQGQALFNRALAYWHAQIFFELESKEGALGFPIISTSPTDIAQMSPERATVADTWDFVIKTLEQASTLLQGHNTDKTRATYWAARALLGKVLMQARKTQEAVPVLEDVIRNSGAQLLDWDTYSKSFYSDEKYEFNKETLYEIDMSMNSKQNGPWGGFTPGSGMQMVMAPWVVNLAGWTSFVSKRNGSWTGPTEPGVEGNTCTNGGWGNNYVNDYSVKRFGWTLGNCCRVRNENFDYKAAGKFASVDNYPWVLPDDFRNRSQQIRDNKECDPRLFIAAGQPYFDTMKDHAGNETWYDVSFTETLMLGTSAHLYFSPRKFTNLEGLESDQNFSSPCNIPVIRLADIYLLYAEAIASSNPQTALEYVNKVHRRAYGCNPEQPSQYDYKSLNDRTMAAAGNAADILGNDVIKYERWAELFAEGQWWYDVRRYEILENEVKVYPTSTYGNAKYIGERQYAQPIPLTEIERYNGGLKQNYDY